MIWEIPSQLHRFSFMIFWYALKAGLINTDILQEENEGRKDHQQQRHDLVNPAQVFFHHKILPTERSPTNIFTFSFFFEYLIVEQFCLCIYALASPSRQRMWLNVLPRRRVSFEKRKTLSPDQVILTKWRSILMPFLRKHFEECVPRKCESSAP